MKDSAAKERPTGQAAHQPADEFLWTSETLCHRKRHNDILKKYKSEVEALTSHDIREAIFSFLCAALNISIAHWVSTNSTTLSWPWLVGLTYVVSATVNHSLFFAMHETSHCSMFATTLMNKIHAVGLNVVMTLPVASSFFFYHREHHSFQGVDDLDTDLPTAFEAKMWRGRLGKACFIMFSPFSYTLRPLFVRGRTLGFFDLINVLVVVITNHLIIRFWGAKSFFYLFGGSILGFSVHPLTAHLVAEHFVFPWGLPFQETYSYYGPLNLLSYNVGYHNEHHDFPRIPGFKLPQLTKLAPEFYKLPHHTSWISVILEFIFNDEVTVFSRVRRATRSGGDPANPRLPPKAESVVAPEGADWLKDCQVDTSDHLTDAEKKKMA